MSHYYWLRGSLFTMGLMAVGALLEQTYRPTWIKLLLAHANIVEYHQINRIHRYVTGHVIASRAVQVTRGVPGDGFHLCHVGFTPVLLYKKTVVTHNANTTRYYAYAPTSTAIEHILSDRVPPNSVATIYQLANDHQHTLVPVPVELPVQCRPAQLAVLDRILQVWTTHRRRAVILLCGASGVGKSTMIRLLYGEVGRITQSTPFVVEGFDPTAEDLNFHLHVCQRRPHNAPLLLLIDEIDQAMLYSETPSPYPINAAASNKASLNKLLDGLSDPPLILTLCTTNMSVAEIREAYPIYTRDGRFHASIDMNA
jgi:hypothetical protein